MFTHTCVISIDLLIEPYGARETGLVVADIPCFFSLRTSCCFVYTVHVIRNTSLAGH